MMKQDFKEEYDKLIDKFEDLKDALLAEERLRENNPKIPVENLEKNLND